MQTATLKVEQLVDYPRCRMYREFLRSLEKNPAVRICRTSYLYFFIVLCSYANYRSSYRRLEGVSYVLGPGEWLFQQSELMDSFRQRRPGTIYPILDFLQANHFISYSRVGSGKLVRVRITEWEKFNTALEYNAPCAKAEGFFFIPMTIAEHLVALGKCSEMDILLDLWLHVVYMDNRVAGSKQGPVVYFGDGSGDPLMSYSKLGIRWGISKSTVCRVFQKLVDLGYARIFSFSGLLGTAIYLTGYLSVMFQISDTPLDKQDVALAFEITVEADEVVSPEDEGVSDVVKEKVIAEVGKILCRYGLTCLPCSQVERKLYRLLDWKGEDHTSPLRYRLDFACSGDQRRNSFLVSQKSEGGADHE